MEDKLKEIVAREHNCRARLIKSVAIKKNFDNMPICQNTVYVFELKGHHLTKQCYAWGSPVKGNKRFYTVLDILPVDSPEKAIRDALVKEKKLIESRVDMKE